MICNLFQPCFKCGHTTRAQVWKKSYRLYCAQCREMVKAVAAPWLPLTRKEKALDEWNEVMRRQE